MFPQLAFILAISFISNFAARLLVSFVRDLRSHSGLEAPDIAFTLTPDLGKAAIFIGYGSTAVIARVEGAPAYKDFMLRQSTSFATSDRSGDLQSRVSQQWGLNERLWRQQNSTEDIDKAAVETVLRGLKAAVEAYLGHSWLDEADFGKPESLVLVIDNSEYGFYLALAYNDDGVMDILRHKYHDSTGNETPSERASLFQQALEEIIKPPLDYISYGKTVPQTIEDLVVYGDDIRHPDFRNALDATLDSRLIRGAQINANRSMLLL
ncbi:heat shock 70 [Fusarium phyllophilum]|uniref:Heat shock 70 n=1 Tax=Fusarium phyllophilum TaxID=47803 RepID=A0A8H5K084_9HYPO|nr:heat shock 70 [Fusarium phyllophilum]